MNFQDFLVCIKKSLRYYNTFKMTFKTVKSLHFAEKTLDFKGFDIGMVKMLFHLVNKACFLEGNAENSLTNATNKFINRLIDVEHLAKANGVHLRETT